MICGSPHMTSWAVYITVGGAFTIDGKCSTVHGEEFPVRD